MRPFPWLADGCLLAVRSCGRKKQISLPLFLRSPMLLNSYLTLTASCNFNHFLKALFPNTVTLGGRASTSTFRGDTIQFTQKEGVSLRGPRM